MRPTRAFVALGAGAALVLSFAQAAAAGPIPALFQQTLCAPPGNNCPTVIEPRQWIWTGDGSGGLVNIHWAKWGGRTAFGTGIEFVRVNWGRPGDHQALFRAEVGLGNFPVEDLGHYVYAIVYTTRSRRSTRLTNRGSRTPPRPCRTL